MILPYASLRQGMVMAWCPSLGDSGYIIRDYSPYNRNGSLVNMDGQVTFAAAPGGIALSLDGSNDYAQTTATSGVPNGAAARTISVWAYPKTMNNNVVRCLVQCVTASGQIFLIDMSQSNSQYFAFTDGVNGANNLTYATAPTLNAWNHVALTMNAARGYVLYHNGAVSRSGTFGSTINTGAITSVRVGNRTGFTTFDGFIDDVRIYNRALSADEVKALSSRRGVGLLPQRTRRTNIPLGSSFWVRQAGEWKKATTWTKVNGVWTKATPKLNVSGTWK